MLTVAEVHCRYAVPSGSADKVLYPVPGTTVLIPSRRRTAGRRPRRMSASRAIW